MTGKLIKWDIKRGYGVYKSVYTEVLQRWIKEGRIKEGEVMVWRSGLSGWRRPEDLDEFRRLFLLQKKKKKKKKIAPPVVPVREKKKRYPKVLVIDDEQDMCWLLENELKKRHFSVQSAYTGRDGLGLVRREKPDVVLLDLRLKDVNGLDVLGKIKQLWPKIKIIIISAFGGPDVKEKAVSLGASGFIDKPFKPKDVVKEIKRVV